MNLDDYQEQAKQQQSTIRNMLSYTELLGLCRRGNEVSNKVKKLLRDGYENNKDYRKEISDEIGDVLWYVAVLSDDIKETFPTLLSIM